MEESLRFPMELLVDHFPLTEQELRTYNSLAFAYVGDAVYEMLIRTMVIAEGNRKPNHYHHMTTRYVNAKGQKALIEAILPKLTEEEKTIFRRGKGAKIISPAKNQTLHDYRIATGFEALIGYLYLSGQIARATELVSMGIYKMEKDC